MRPPALTSCLLLALAARAAAAPRCTVLWIPPPSFSAWSQLDALLKDHRGLRLTVGVSEDMLNPSALRALKPWIDDGRLEAALRLDGDPLLPLIAGQAEAPRPEDPAARLAVELERWKAAAGFTPAGFAPGAGAASRELLGTLGSMGLRWAATGAYSPDAAWSSYDGVAAVPLRAVRSDSSSVAVPDLTGGPVVVDESDGLVAEGSLLRWLRSSAVSACDWSTVSKALASRSLAPAAAGSWPAWTGDLEEWTSSASAQTAWSLYGQAARLLDQYQNSGTADLKQLDEATNELYAAQANRYYRAPPQGQAAAIAAEFHSHLANIYRDLGRTPPDSLLDVAVSSAAVSADLRVEQGQGWIQFDNPDGLTLAPLGLELQGGAPPSSLWRIESLRIESSEAGETLIYTMARLDANSLFQPAPRVAPDLGRVLLETYIDLNHVQRAGSTRLLFDRGAFIQPRDAWEYALAISAWGAFLYRSRSLGSPVLVGHPGVATDADTRQVRVTIPASILSGNPATWGYVVTTADADVRTAYRPPVKPERQEDGSTILGLLAPADQQKAFLGVAPSARPPLSAARIPEF